MWDCLAAFIDVGTIVHLSVVAISHRQFRGVMAHLFSVERMERSFSLDSEKDEMETYQLRLSAGRNS